MHERRINSFTRAHARTPGPRAPPPSPHPQPCLRLPLRPGSSGTWHCTHVVPRQREERNRAVKLRLIASSAWFAVLSFALVPPAWAAVASDHLIVRLRSDALPASD